MMSTKLIPLYSFILLITISCTENDTSNQLLIHGGEYWSGHDDISHTTAIAIADGLISKIYTDDSWKEEKHPVMIDATGHFVMPGIIEGHGHFSYLGKGLQSLNFLADTSWQQIVKKVEEKVATSEKDQWIYGRGWHQEKWAIPPDQSEGQYPTHHSLTAISQDNPVVLVHASGHSLFANAKAMELAGINLETQAPVGGAIIRDATGEAIGVFEENAMNPINTAYQSYLDGLSEEQNDSLWYNAIELATAECIQYGITSFQDAGSKYYEIDRYQQLGKDGKLGIRLWAMLREKVDNLKSDLSQYRYESPSFSCTAIKSELDGALGAHGAWLIEPYADKPGFVGQNTTTTQAVRDIADIAVKNNMQLCVHAIGDKANQETINIFIEKTNGSKNHRWRIEHAQHLDTTDFSRMAEYNIIASMQAIHCTSDAPFVEKRLGMERAKYGSYSWRSLLDAGVVVSNGTDTPVEDVNPFHSIYSSVTRKHPLYNNPAFYPEQNMTREEALQSYTWAPAYSAFEDHVKGTIETGKYGDIAILDRNLLTCSEDEIITTNALYTILGGEVIYNAKE